MKLQHPDPELGEVDSQKSCDKKPAEEPTGSMEGRTAVSTGGYVSGVPITII